MDQVPSKSLKRLPNLQEKGKDRKPYDLKIVKQTVFQGNVKKLSEGIRSRSISPGQGRFSQMQKSNIPKEDIFRNPSAIYLSRKQIFFGRMQRVNDHSTPLRPVKKKHGKTRSLQVPDTFNLLPVKKQIELVPLNSFKNLSPTLRKKTSEMLKNLHCDALKRFSSLCDDSIRPSRRIESHEKSVLKKYTEDINWLATASVDYSDYEPKIAKELIKVSQHSRNLFDNEREKIVSQIRSGDFDPNKNVFKIRALLKRKKAESPEKD
jgi:hypothetical protein